MIFSALADLVVGFHLLFILFAVLGGILVLWRRGFLWLHLPILVWAALIEFAGWICPLTPLENRLRVRGGGMAYPGSFVERYIVPLVYPAALTRRNQIFLGCLLVALNALVYGLAWGRSARRRRGCGH